MCVCVCVNCLSYHKSLKIDDENKLIYMLSYLSNFKFSSLMLKSHISYTLTLYLIIYI